MKKQIISNRKVGNISYIIVSFFKEESEQRLLNKMERIILKDMKSKSKTSI